ncbi:ribosomal RNA small subunit methyltransferase A [Candidatus Kaiserbacteria bacterium]|nr:ribosomal RNA small subunit methyltransferase A [Candidatus Kaiserbacteria bacterium]
MGSRLGQHFLKHTWAARKLAHAAAPRAGETIVEIGPGKGVLTRELLALSSVIAIEKDETLVAKLRETFATELDSGRLQIISADIRDITPEQLGLHAGSYVVAANIPYYITGEIIRQFLSTDAQPRAMALLVQKEVAQRIVSKKESILSISVKAYGIPKIVEKVSRTHFSPPPKVDSAILLIADIAKSFFREISEERFFAVVRAGFASRRKFVANNLSALFDRATVQQHLEAAGIAEKARAEDVSLEQWKKLAQ